MHRSLKKCAVPVDSEVANRFLYAYDRACAGLQRTYLKQDEV